MDQVTDAKEKKEKIYSCIGCNRELDFSKVDWHIGHFTGMKTKTVVCYCGKTNSLSVSVGSKTPPMFKGLI